MQDYPNILLMEYDTPNGNATHSPCRDDSIGGGGSSATGGRFLCQGLRALILWDLGARKRMKKNDGRSSLKPWTVTLVTQNAGCSAASPM